MRILFYYLHGGGGAFSNVKLLLATLARENPTDTFLLAGQAGMDFGAAATLPNVETIRIPVRGGREWTRLQLGWGGLKKLCRAKNVDVLWSLNLGPYRHPGVPFVLGVNNPHQVYSRAVTRHHPGSSLHVEVMRWFFRRSLACADAALVQTDQMGELVRQSAGRSLPIEVVPKAVESESDVAAQPLPEPLAGTLAGSVAVGWFPLLYVATAIPHKNHRVLVELAHRLQLANEKISLVVSVREDELTALGCEGVAAVVRSGHLRPIGWAAKEHLAALYAACHGCVMPSYIESLSSAHLEAMQWARPQVCADVPYARDLCRDAALYAAPDRAGDWLAAVRRLRDDADLRRRLVDAGRERMRAFPDTWSEVARRVRQFLGRFGPAQPIGAALPPRLPPDPAAREASLS